MKKTTIDDIPTWIYEIENEPDGNKIIDDHLKSCGSLIQIDNLGTKDPDNLIKAVKSVKKVGVTPIFIHVYPEDENHISTVSIYIQEDIRKGERKKGK